MCGIFGLILPGQNGLFADEEGFLKQAFITNSVRGEDGTGAFWVDAKDPSKVNSLKRAGNPWWLFTDKEYPAFMEGARKSAKAFVGHNRWSTKGKNSDENTHPFQSNHITMVHNGTIHTGLTYDKHVEVDSHALTIAIAEQGIEAFAKISGAFVCVWHDAKTETLNICKNNERPLSMIKQNGAYLFASEMGMLKWLTDRNSNSYKKIDEITIKNNTLYSFNLAKLEEPKEEPLPEKKYTQYEKKIYPVGNNTISSVSGKTDYAIIVIRKRLTVNVKPHEIYTYLCTTDDMEACWFRSNTFYPINDTDEYYAELAGMDWNKFSDFGSDIPWYRIKPKTLAKLEKKQGELNLVPMHTKNNVVELTSSLPGVSVSKKERDRAAQLPCLTCDMPHQKEELLDSEIIEVAPNRYRMMCPACTTHYALPKEESETVQ